MSALAPVLQAYFTERLAQRQDSPHTVASYRDTFCLLLRFAQQQLGPIALDLRYVDTWSPLLDAAILARTTRAVLYSAGAY